MTLMGKKTALIAGLAALAVITLGLFSWREIAVRFYMTRFRSEPKRFIAAIDQPEGSVQAQALKRLVATGNWPGTELLQCYLAELARIDINFRNHFSSINDEARFFISASGDIDFNGTSNSPGWAIQGGGFSAALVAPESVVKRLKAIQDLLGDAHFKTSTMPDYPGAVFTFLMKGNRFPENTLALFDREAPLKESCCFVQWPERIRIKEEEYQKRLSEMSVRMMNDLKKRQLTSPQAK
jgi:hypothetical protein